MFKRTKKEPDFSEAVEAFNQGLTALPVSDAVDDNVDLMKRLFENVDIMRYRFVAKDGDRAYAIVFSDGMVDAAVINEHILQPLMSAPAQIRDKDLMKRLTAEVVQVGEAELTGEFKKIVGAVTYGDTVLFADGCAEAAILNTKSFALRSIDEPDSEKSLLGPREGFTESMTQNVSMLRRRARTNDLKIRQMSFGKKTRTSAVICYFDSVVTRRVLDDLLKRLEGIDIDGVLDTNYLAELIREHRFSLFRTIGYTERPDTVIGRLLEGRVAIVLDGTPMALTLPYLFIENFQSSEDYYMSFYYGSFSRMLRMLGFLMTITVPGLYIAIVAFQHEMLPTPLLINVTAERQSVPLPAAVEAFVMLTAFDILRETGVRMPNNIGQALSIVGALVVGQAAVEAKLVAAPMIIVVAITGITGLLVPKLNAPAIYLRLFVLLMSSMFGFFGLTISLSLILVHLIALDSFGIPLVSLDGGTRLQQTKDIAIRAPWWTMILRPTALTGNRTRMKPGGGGHA
ncbi:MAG: spore germination protein [Christensenellaceae bacterium]|nr:spore germination protein [Christensenellaceae bacterium]MEA5065512.1 spore germination protein [Eubacteriales bacterium]MEA5068385.1 spore germination protein [Christensenellaceae bacterium]